MEGSCFPDAREASEEVRATLAYCARINSEANPLKLRLK